MAGSRPMTDVRAPVEDFLVRLVENDECDCGPSEQIWEPGGGSYTTEKGPWPICRRCEATALLAALRERSEPTRPVGDEVPAWIAEKLHKHRIWPKERNPQFPPGGNDLQVAHYIYRRLQVEADAAPPVEGRQTDEFGPTHCLTCGQSFDTTPACTMDHGVMANERQRKRGAPVEGEPVAYAIYKDGHLIATTFNRLGAEEIASVDGWSFSPLVRTPTEPENA